MASIHGVDINPFAVAIARFRLTVAGLKATAERSLVGVPAMGFRLAIGDSLLGVRGGLDQTFDFDDDEAGPTFSYDTEDLNEYFGILQPGQYHVVVGNPPYITPKDKALNARYRLAYASASGKYALSAPFMELLFRLAIRGEQGQGAGYVGQITSNSFMKREFGKKLIEHVFAGHDIGNPVDLTAVIDTSGAYIPGHGTPTVIIVGRRRRPVADQVRAVLGVRGEPGQPANPSKGLVWTDIVEHVDHPGYDGSFVTVVDLERRVFTSHPWSIRGGGVNELLEAVGSARVAVAKDRVLRIGFFGIMGADEVFIASQSQAGRSAAESSYRPLIVGDRVRDFTLTSSDPAFFPYDEHHELRALDTFPVAARRLWPYRTDLGNRVTFARNTYFEEGRPWYVWHQLPKDAAAHEWSIAFAEVATHNHFVLARGGTVFMQSAPIIKLRAGASEDEHLELLGVLNSSTACFWLKQVAHNKGSTVDSQGARQTQVPWEDFYAFSSTKVGQLPLPRALPLDRARTLDMLARDLHGIAPAAVVQRWLAAPKEHLSDKLAAAEVRWRGLRARLILEQEELDWEIYRLYDLIDFDLTYSGSAIDGILLGQRAFEVDLARRVEEGVEETAWFERHNSTPITGLPEAWPDDYKALVKRRLDLIDTDKAIRLLERPEFKRRWATTGWDIQRTEALQAAILDRLEDPSLWQDQQGPTTRSVAELADLLRADPVLKELARALTGTAEPDLGAVIGALVPDEAVPFLAAYRYKPAGVEKYLAWQEVWALQRREDAGEKVTIPVPPKYGQGDFAKATYWRARGKLDVPKERFIAYPGVAREGDATPVLGWAGWSHRDQALALAREIPVQQALGADDEALVPLVAGLVELEPWLAQWHLEIEPQFGASPASVISGVVDQYLARMEKTRDQVTAWTPPTATRGRRASR